MTVLNLGNLTDLFLFDIYQTEIFKKPRIFLIEFDVIHFVWFLFSGDFINLRNHAVSITRP